MRVHGIWRGIVGMGGGSSALLSSFHQAPLKAAKPFAGEKGELVLYLMDASPGLFNGDVQEIDCTVEKGASLFLTNQSSCKLHPSPDPSESRQIQRFHLREGAVLEYFPEPLVPYKGARHLGETVVCMETGAQAIIGEILTPGRAGRGETFQYQTVASRFSVFWEEELAVWDSLLLEPGRWRFAKGIFEEYTHVATLWVLSGKVTNLHVQMIRDLLLTPGSDSACAGVSLLSRNGLVVRMLGRSAWGLQTLMHRCWDRVRRELLGKPAFQIRK